MHVKHKWKRQLPECIYNMTTINPHTHTHSNCKKTSLDCGSLKILKTVELWIDFFLHTFPHFPSESTVNSITFIIWGVLRAYPIFVDVKYSLSLNFSFRDSKTCRHKIVLRQCQGSVPQSYWRKCKKITWKKTTKTDVTHITKERYFVVGFVFPSWRILFLAEEQSVHFNFYLSNSSKSKVRTTSFLHHRIVAAVWFITLIIFLSPPIC